MLKKSKGMKIKRYSKKWNRRKRSTLLKWFVFTAACLFLLFIGYSVMGPVMDYMRGTLEPSPPMSSSDRTSHSESESDPNNSDSSDSSGDPAPPAQTVEFNAKLLPQSALSSAAAITAFCENAKREGFDAIVIMMKDQNGNIHYQSANELAVSRAAIVPGSITAAEIHSAVNQVQMRSIAMIHTLNDNLISTWASENTYLYQNNAGTTWYDRNPANGGRKWLNPYRTAAREYISSLAGELADAGFADILLYSVEYPNVEMANAGLGETSGLTMVQALNLLVSDVETAVKAKGANVINSFYTSELDSALQRRYRAAVSELKADGFAPIFDNLTDQTDIAELIGKISAVSDISKITPVFTGHARDQELKQALEGMGVKTSIQQ
ncbi:MAG: putative glycoside hydrolase [Oscillospiraceae bacterium]|nr:putative glycoside hydrolase [Oscillospiraceae bacterium]